MTGQKLIPENRFSWKKVLNAILPVRGILAAQKKSVELLSDNDLNGLDNVKKERCPSIAINPNHTDSYNEPDTSDQESAELNEAEKYYRQIIAVNPDCAEAYNNLAVILQESGHLDEAEKNYQLAIAINPNYFEVYSNLGAALEKLGRLDEAEKNYRRAIAINPNYADAYNNLAVVLRESGRLDEAEKNHRQAIAINPDYAESYNHLAAILHESGRLDEAEKNYRRAIAINPHYAEAHYNLGLLLTELFRFDEAEVSYRNALSVRPNYAEAHASLALLLILSGRFQEGWAEYQWIYHPKNTNPSRQKPPDLSAKQWQGEALQGKTILIYSEQGFGDMIQFMRYAEYLQANGATVWVLAAKPLFELFKTIPWVNRVLREDEQYQTVYDFWVFASMLPFWFQTTLETVPINVPYLSVNNEKSVGWQGWLNQQIPQGNKRVGLVWAGNPNHLNDKNRSISFAELSVILDVPNISFVSLQLGDKARVDIADYANIIDASLFIQDFMDSAALLTHLDLLITVDSAPAHLAGALNLPVWLLITKLPDWRWLLNRSDSVWYKSVRLFRQPEKADWGSVLSDVKTALIDI